jgi:hypothetical protein
VTTSAPLAPAAFAEATSQRFYVRIAATFVAVAVLGFLPTYWMPMARGTLATPPIIHLHALLFFGWTVLFYVQTSLAASGNLQRHREVGVAGVSLATGMLFVGLATAVITMKRADAAGFGPAERQFVLVSVSAILLFAALVAVALLNVRNPDVHKRLMLAATASLLQAPVGRVFAFFLAPPGRRPGPPPIAVTIQPGLVIDLLIVAGMIHDRRASGRVHPAYWFGGGSVLAVQLLRVPLAGTQSWIRVTDWLVAVLS